MLDELLDDIFKLCVLYLFIIFFISFSRFNFIIVFLCFSFWVILVYIFVLVRFVVMVGFSFKILSNGFKRFGLKVFVLVGLK